MPLTDAAIRKAKPGAVPKRLSDGDGLYLLVQPHGGKWWRFDYRYNGIRKTLSLGVYDDVSLATARQRLRDARALVASGQDPAAARREAKREAAKERDTFSAVATEWLARQAPVWAENTRERAAWQIGLVSPWLGTRPIADIEPPELLEALRRIERHGHHDTAHRVKQRVGQIMRYAIVTGRARRDPSADLRGALTPVRATHRAAVVEPEKVGALLHALDGYQGSFVTAIALRLLPLVFVRPGELRHAAWSEFDLAGGLWRIPAGRMKMKEGHIVPLSRQAIALLEELQPLTGLDDFCFPSPRSKKRPISDNTLNAALRRLGYGKDEMTAHGFRTIASTMLNELGWAPDLIERQLAHVERNAVRRAYNRAQHLPERRRMMQAWADHLDALRAAPVTARRRARGKE